MERASLPCSYVADPFRAPPAAFAHLSRDTSQQIIRASLKNPLDVTKLSLIYANVTHEDILLKSELDTLAAKHPERFSVFYVLNNPPEKWNGGVGFVNTAMIKEHLPAPAVDSKMLLCGESRSGVG